MKCPFPGMDPFLEGQKWRGVHHGLISAIQLRLVPQLRPAYIVDVEESVYLARDDDQERWLEPDVAISESVAWSSEASGETAVIAEPVVRTLPKPRKVRQAYLTILTAKGREVVTVIEVLSPWNKTGDGYREYLDKRDDLLGTPVNLIELDLLRGGRRLPTCEPLPPGDFFALVSRGVRRPEVDVYAWRLRQPLPKIPLPLAEGDADLSLDLQSLFQVTYDQAGFDYSLDYDAKVVPALSETEMEWVRSTLEANAPD